MKTSIHSIRKFIRSIILEELSNRQKRKQQKSQGVKKIAETDEFVVLKILTRDACILYGKGTKWCVSSRDKDESWNTFVSADDSLYVVLMKKSHRKFAISFYGGDDLQIWDERNVTVGDEDIPPAAINAIVDDHFS